MKKLILLGGLIALYSCSSSANAVERKFNSIRPKGKGYEFSAVNYEFNVPVAQIYRYNKKGKVKDSLWFYYDGNNVRKIDKNGNVQVPLKDFKSLEMQKIRVFPIYPSI